MTVLTDQWKGAKQDQVRLAIRKEYKSENTKACKFSSNSNTL